MTDMVSERSFAPDMGHISVRLPAEQIVLLSWIVSEYDGIGYVKTESVALNYATKNAVGLEALKNGKVSLFFPDEKRSDVIELICALQNEGFDLTVLPERAGAESATHELLEASDLQ
ncbi:MAG: DUF4911 domain-containing protein [Synergistaceae bacterium]|nr:hypothetical protein [Synergistota bacterium]NLM70599.1 DUF4911 domain-containing protein [Synergistaceae bacterium]